MFRTIRVTFLLAFSLLTMFASATIQGQKPELIVQTGHSGSVMSVAFSPDGNTLASLSDDHTVKLWDVITGKQLRTLKRPSDLYGWVTFSPDGRLLLSDGGDESLQLWDVSTGLLIKTFNYCNVATSTFSPDSKTLAGISRGKLNFWDTSTGTLLRTFSTPPASTLAFNPEGSVLASGGPDGTIKLWDASSGAELRTFKGIAPKARPGLTATVERMPEIYYNIFGVSGFSSSASGRANPDHATASAGHEFAVVHLEVKPTPGMHHFSIKDPVLYDAAGRKYSSFVLTELTLSHLSRERKADFAFDIPVGASLKSLKFENYTFDFDTQSLSVDNSLPKYSRQDHEAVTALAFSPDGKTLASGSLFLVRLWDVSSGKETSALEAQRPWVRSIKFSRSGKQLLTFHDDSFIALWDIASGTDLGDLDADAIALRADGKLVSAVARLGHIQLQLGGTDWRQLSRTTDTVESVASNPAGPTLASSGNAVTIWSLGGGVPRKLKGSETSNVAFSPDGTMVAGGGANGTIKLWNVANGTLVRSITHNSLESLSNVIGAIAFSPDNQTLAAVTNGGSVVLWNSANGRRIRSIELADTEPICLAFSPDGRTLAIGTGLEGDEFFGIELWRVSTGRRLRAIKGHTASVQSVSFSPNGRIVASGSWDGTVRLWNVMTGNNLHTQARSFTGSVAFSPDGRLLASGSEDVIKLSSVATGKELNSLKGHLDSVNSIEFSPDGKYLWSCSRDSSIKLWDVSAGKELASLFTLGENDWLVVTPEGLFDGSPAAWNDILWRFNKNTFDHAPVEAFFNEFYYPNLLADIFSGKHPKAATDISEKDRRQPNLKLTLADSQVSSNIGSRSLKINVDVSEIRPDKDHKDSSGARDVRLFRNGSLVKVWHGDVLNGKNSVTFETTIPIVAGENKFTAYAFNHDNIKSGDAELVVTGADSLKRPGTAYILAIGVNEYSNSQYNLRYAVADADDFSAEVKRQQELLKRYAKVEVTSLSDAQATNANITQKLAELAKQVQPEDAVIVYFAGHGTAQGNQFYLIPHDLGYTGARDNLDEAGLKIILDHSISDRELEKLFEGIDAGQLLLVIDACNSGQALEAEEKRRGPMNSKGLAQLAYEKGMYVMTAAQSYQAAQEAQKLGHGFLTYALVESGLKQGAADREPKNGTIDIREWLNFATDEVPRMQEENSQRALSGKGRYVVFVGDGTRTRDATPNAPVVDNIQRPRIFYRRELEANPLVIAVTKSLPNQ